MCIGSDSAKHLLPVVLAALLLACAPVNSTSILFTSEPIASREELSYIRHSGDFTLFYDREQKTLYGMIENSDLNKLPTSRVQNVDWTDLENMSVFFDYIPRSHQVEECDTTLSIEPDQIGDDFFAQFGEVTDEFRQLGYPLAGATYVGDGDGYEVELIYYTECEFLERDARDFARKLSRQ
jgi:hypothetical protein